MNITLPLSPLVRLALALQDGDWREAIALDARVGHEFQPYYETADWQSAADEALHGDSSDLSFMLEREAAYQDFQRWQRGDYRNREFAGFDNWLADKAAWNRSAAA